MIPNRTSSWGCRQGYCPPLPWEETGLIASLVREGPPSGSTERFGPMRTIHKHTHGFHIPFSVGAFGIMTLKLFCRIFLGSAASHEQPRVTGLKAHTLSAPIMKGEIA